MHTTMHPTDAAYLAALYLRRLIPKGAQEEQELLHVIQSLSSFASPEKPLYTNKR
jgi:hypothetical protein